MSVSVCQVQVYRPYDPFNSLGAIPAVGGAPLDSRKRTTSFSSPPRKRLHRTDSYVDLSFAVSASSASFSSSASTATPSASTPVPYNRTLRFYKEQKERRRALLRREPPVLDPSSSRSCAPTATPVSLPVSPSPTTPRVTRQKTTPPPPPPPPPRARSTPPSPLALAASPSPSAVKCALTPPPPVRAPMPTRSSSRSSSSNPDKVNVRTTSPPRTKGKSPDLHRRAVTACMRASPSGAKILHMGARLAVGIMSATRELERMCGEGGGSSRDAEGDDATAYGGILDEEMDLEDAEGEDEEDDLDAEGVEDEDMVESDEDAPLQMRPMGRVIVPAPQPSSSPVLERVQCEGEATDVPMPDAPVMSASWIVVGDTPREDWEMVEGA